MDNEADPSFLALMFNSQAMFPEMQPVLYAADVRLAAFWAALQPCRTELAHLGNGKSRTTMMFNVAGASIQTSQTKRPNNCQIA